MSELSKPEQFRVEPEASSPRRLPFLKGIGLLSLLALLLYVPGMNWGLPAVVSWSQDTIAGVRTLGAVEGWPTVWHGRYPPLHYFLLRAAYEPPLRYWRHASELRIDPRTGREEFTPPHAPKIGLLLWIARAISIVMAIGTVIALWLSASRLTAGGGLLLTPGRHASSKWPTSPGWPTFSGVGGAIACTSRIPTSEAIAPPGPKDLGHPLVAKSATERDIGSSHHARLIAAVLFMIGAEFAYFARLGNVDVPSMFWFAWSVYFYVRTLRSNRTGDALLLGLFGSLAISTKDSVAGAYPGMAVVLLITQWRHFRAVGFSGSRAFVAALFRPRWLAGVAAFVLPYLLINGVFWNFDGYIERMKYWLDITLDTIHARQHRYPNQLVLVAATLHQAAGAIGWPHLAALAASILYGFKKHRTITLVLLVPAITYYVIIIARMGFVYARFLFPMLFLMYILLGLAAFDFWRWRACPRAVRVLTALALIVPSLGYALAVSAEMRTDSRYAAERWFAEHVSLQAPVGASSKPQYLPRLNQAGYATYMVEMTAEAFRRPQPDYLVLSSYDYEDYNEDQAQVMNDLLDGKLGYKEVARFQRRFLGSGSSWLSVAGWGATAPGKISPTIIVLHRASFDP